uniref:Fibronectin type-III domain-containing protein n=1 Tax=uncultured prokaryote TaxID=198431 RepID=H5SPZ3_9ZZZZ|nr:hypothetical protein HGMM_F55D02C29 [uncultured prokaryote]
MLGIFIWACGKKDFPVYPQELAGGFIKDYGLLYRNGEWIVFIDVIPSTRIVELIIEDSSKKIIKRLPYTLQSNIFELNTEPGIEYVNIFPVFKNKLWGLPAKINFPSRLTNPVLRNFSGRGEGKGRFVIVEWECEREGTAVLFNIYRVDKSPLIPVNFAPLADFYFVDNDVREGETYTYFVRPVTFDGNIIFEGEAYGPIQVFNGTVKPSPPDFVDVMETDSMINAVWNMPGEDVDGFNVYLLCGKNLKKLNRDVIRGTAFSFKEEKTKGCSVGVSSVNRRGVEGEIKFSPLIR